MTKPFVMFGIFIALLLAGLYNEFSIPVTAQDKPVQLSELSQLKKQNLELRASLTQCSVNLNSIKASEQLTAEQKKLQEEFSKELNCQFDWAKGTCSEIKPVQ